MKKIGWALFITVFIFFLSLIVIAPLISNIWYSSVEGSYIMPLHKQLCFH